MGKTAYSVPLLCSAWSLANPTLPGVGVRAVEGAVFEHETDLAVVAVGTRSNPILLESTPGLELNKWGYIVTDEETGETSIPNVFAGGDIVTGAATVILAMGAGRRAAQEIARRLLGEETVE